MKVLYSKCNRFRLSKFQVETQILSVNNKKIVRKKALTEEAKQHILDLIQGNELLGSQILDPHVRVSAIIAKSTESVDYEFIDGVGLDKWMFESIVRRDPKRFLNLTKKYHELLTNAFVTTESMTGTCPFFDANEAALFSRESLFHSIAWFDPIPDNLLWCDDVCYLIDTEWVFPFSVPVSFEFFRGISNLYYKYRQYDIDGLCPFSQLLRPYGFSDEKIKQFSELENTFQDYVYGKNRKLLTFSNYLQKNYAFHSEEIKANFELLEKKFGQSVRLFIDTGHGFNETQSIVKPVQATDRIIEFDLASYSNVKMLRFDPLNDLAMIRLHDIHLEVENGKAIPVQTYRTNAGYQQGNELIFNTEDPHLIFSSPVRQAQKVVINLEYIALGPDTYKHLLSCKDIEFKGVLSEVERLSVELKTRNKEISNFQNHIHEVVMRLDAIQSSPAWRLSSPIRRLEKRTPRLMRIWVGAAQAISWTAGMTLRNRLLMRRRVRQILDSGLFDHSWYVLNNPDIVLRGWMPITHYLQHGALEGRDPNPLFDTDWYLGCYPDVAQSGVNPLAHYLEHGALEGRDPNPLFDTDWYLRRYADVAQSGVNPLAHYLEHGALEGRDPNPLFDTDWYLGRYPDVAQSGVNPLAHYLQHGALEGRDPNPLFDTDWYLGRHPDIAQSGVNPLIHYFKYGTEHGCDPHPLFDSDWYLEQCPDVAQAGLNPLAHYLQIGAREGRSPNKLLHQPGEPVLRLPFRFLQWIGPPDGGIAVILHMFYPGLASEFTFFLNHICHPYDLFISTDTEEKAILLQNAFSDVNARSVSVQIVPNRGRDIGPKLISFREVYDSHSFILFLHSKISYHDDRLADWRNFILNCLLGSPAIVESVLEAFARLPQLGIVAPRNFPTVRPYMNWDVNFLQARSLAERMGITIMPDSPLDFPAGSMFWARSSALQPLIDIGLSFEDFPEEANQTDGTLTHAVERLYFYACEKAGLRWIHAGDDKNIQSPEWLFNAGSPAELERCVSDQMPSLLLLGIRPKPTGMATTDPTGDEAVKEAFRNCCIKDLDTFLGGESRIMLPLSGRPKVSILLVLFNQAGLTFHCLQSLQRTLDDSAEVIIVDNASTDRTAELLQRVDGVQVLRNSKNLHFLHGVNAGAEKARGKYLLILNNDIRLKAGSIAAACRKLDEEEDIGAVGGKIVSLNGTLQEAGSIIWRDGTCIGYGRGRDPGEAEFQFCRDVDYCSAAFLMVRRDLFERLGRFDKDFAPAYYEETDLCMRIRGLGFRIVYDPAVEVSHFEFGSADTSDEAIAMQKQHRTVFVERHRTELDVSHLPSTTRHLDARMRTRGIGRVLVVDDGVPYPTLGSGYPRAFCLLKTLIQAGWFVTHYPLVFPGVCFAEAYALLPREVEIIAGPGRTGLAEFLRSRTGYYNAVIVSRPHNMDFFNEACRMVPEFLTQTPLIYDAEAVFAARKALRPERLVNDRLAEEDRQKIHDEIMFANQARIVLTVNEREADLFRASGKYDVRVLGHSLNVRPTVRDFASRKDFLFVGSLDEDDSPNTDSLIWFVNEVMPRLDCLIGHDYVLNVVGRSGSPKVRKLANDRVKLLGKIEDIQHLYDASRIFIAPTRYASGIPLKIHEAASVGLPVVATGLLGRQLGWTDGVELLTADRPEDFALACHRLYEDPELWGRLREAAISRIAQDCSPDRFAKTIHCALRDVTGLPENHNLNLTTAGRRDRVKQTWSSDPAERYEKHGWYWMKHPMVVSRLNNRISGDPAIDAYMHLRRLLEDLGWQLPVKRVISLGCGFGALERRLALIDVAERIDAYDLVEEAIREARRVAAAEGIDKIRYHVFDLENPELLADCEGSIDIIFAHQSVHHIEDLEGLCRRVHRALRPGGIFHLHEFVGPDRFQWPDDQLREINSFVAALPRKYRLLPSGKERPVLQRPTIAEMLSSDPSEAVRSSAILPVVKRYFKIIEQRDIGGSLLHLGLGDIAQNFRMDEAEDRARLERFFALEDQLMERGVVGSDFVVVTAIKD